MEAEQSHNNGRKVRLLCSYGGKIKSRPTDHQLSYVGGDTKIVAVDRTVRFSELVAKLNSLSNSVDGAEISAVKYQLPGEDLDSLVSLIDDDDVEHMMVEYDRMQRISPKPPRLRIFVFAAPSPPPKPDPNPDYLFGFDKEYQPSVEPPTPTYISQIPPENGGARVEAAAIPMAAQAFHRVPAGVSECVYRNGYCAFGEVNGNWEQPVYNFIPVMPPVTEQRVMMASMGLNGSRRNF